MSSHFTVVYDACTLYPTPLRDLLMHLALSDLFRARWSNMIHDEWIRNVHANRPDLNLERLERTRAHMNHAVRDCVVTGFEYMIPSINLKDFPDEALKPYNLAAQHPDDFIVDLLDLHPAGVLEAAASHRRSLKSPPKTADEYLDTLLAQGLTQSVAVMRQWTVAM